MFEYNEGVALLGYRGEIIIKSWRFSCAAELGGGLYATS